MGGQNLHIGMIDDCDDKIFIHIHIHIFIYVIYYTLNSIDIYLVVRYELCDTLKYSFV